MSQEACGFLWRLSPSLAKPPKIVHAYNDLGSCILSQSERRMGRYHEIFLNVAYCLLVFCVADLRPLLIGGLFKLIASLLLACLLAFVVVHSANICRLVTACFQVFPINRFRLPVDRRWAGRSQSTAVIANEPSLSPLFQRPPPIFSF
jgi:hypothetical protein